MVYGIAKMLNFAHGDHHGGGLRLTLTLSPVISFRLWRGGACHVRLHDSGHVVGAPGQAPCVRRRPWRRSSRPLGVSYFLQNLAPCSGRLNPKIFPRWWEKGTLKFSARKALHLLRHHGSPSSPAGGHHAGSDLVSPGRDPTGKAMRACLWRTRPRS